MSTGLTQMSSKYYLLIYLLTYCSLRQMECGAATKERHFCLSLAIFCRLRHEWFNLFISASTIRRHIILGLPLRHFPSGVQKRAVLVRSCWTFLKTCPIHLHLLLLMMVFMFSWLHLLRSWLEILFGQNIRRIFLRLFVWKVESFCWSASVIQRQVYLTFLSQYNHLLIRRYITIQWCWTIYT